MKDLGGNRPRLSRDRRFSRARRCSALTGDRRPRNSFRAVRSSSCARPGRTDGGNVRRVRGRRRMRGLLFRSEIQLNWIGGWRCLRRQPHGRRPCPNLDSEAWIAARCRARKESEANVERRTSYHLCERKVERELEHES